MTVLVPVAPATAGELPEGYDLIIGPLRFTCPLDALGETLGDGLDTVGAALTPSERRPRPLKLKLPVRAWHRETDAVEVGRRLRRQVRQLLDNPSWRFGGLFLHWQVDEDLDGWLLIGGGDLTETDAGVTFADYELELSDVYVVARPGTHRPARRLDLADRRAGTVPRDSRGTLFSTDFSSQALPAEPLAIAGDVVSVTGANHRLPASNTAGPLIAGRRLWRTVAADNGEAVSYMPDELLVPGGRLAYHDVDELGSVRAWDLSTAFVYPPLAAGYAQVRDAAPDVYYGWERVLGDPLTVDRPLAIENGAVRALWLGPAATEGLAIEYYDAALGAFRREARVLSAAAVTELSVVEITPERGVIELRAADKALRVILQRGWWGPRLEAFNDSGGTASIEYAPDAGAPVLGVSSPTWVDTLTAGGRTVLWARGTSADARDTTPTVITGPAVCYRRARTVVAQLAMPPGPTGAQLASLSLVDARSAPVLVSRPKGA
jgi:hypothetical protein